MSGSEWFSTEQPVRHNTGHQQSLPHTGYQHGTALGTRSVLLETSSKPGSSQTEKRGLTESSERHLAATSETGSAGVVLCLCLDGSRAGVSASGPAYLLLVQLEGGLDQIPQGCELLLLLVLSLFDLKR